MFADIKDSLMQALASYVCYPQSLRAVERIPEEQRVAMMRNLLAPYEQPWLRPTGSWCASGGYTRLPHLLKTKPEDANLPSLQSTAVPLVAASEHMAELLSVDKEMAASFLNSVLNQLNWAFSEFIGMIQRCVRPASICPVSLLRVLEMTVTLVPEIPGLDPTVCRASAAETRSAAEPGVEPSDGEKNLFDRVVNLRLPGLESVDHYPILVAVTGILVRVLVDGDRQGCTAQHFVALCSAAGDGGDVRSGFRGMDEMIMMMKRRKEI
ncbi:hypothetical protein F7725_016261 [Dissostichus mawsoni]|uniref:E3 ubiquitin-protein ligase RNF123/RKP TPR repeat domain-containing protein n=1 Tax=Dissostichus mawsoni TaxID=36200 RepID=A0A7J5Z5F3_DISMA|nr:hypothetical protein F7725_016261 [Dissostichus mawsoni]